MRRSCVAALTVAAAGFALLAPASASASVLKVEVRPRPGAVWVAAILYRAPAHIAPARSARVSLNIRPTTEWGTPNELLVLDKRVDARGETWLRVEFDHRPNGYARWIESRFTYLWVDPWSITVSRPARTISVYRNGIRRRWAHVVVGKPSTPTPGGLFAIAAELLQPSAQEFTGSWILPLTAHSNVLQEFEGGPGQIAIHGRGGASFLNPLGTAASHGCIRIENSLVDWIASRVPVGTPVLVR
jgi:hypothetical protein